MRKKDAGELLSRLVDKGVELADVEVLVVLDGAKPDSEEVLDKVRLVVHSLNEAYFEYAMNVQESLGLTIEP